jgi:hypothetical protein
LKKLVSENYVTLDKYNEFIDTHDINDIKDISSNLSDKINEYLNIHFPEIQLGLRGNGTFVFTWNYNSGKYYSDNLDSIKKFIEEGNYDIYNEYGEYFTWDQFINEEIGNLIYKTDKLYDPIEFYSKNNPDSIIKEYIKKFWYSKDGLLFINEEIG